MRFCGFRFHHIEQAGFFVQPVFVYVLYGGDIRDVSPVGHALHAATLHAHADESIYETRADRQAVQRRTPVPVRFEFRLVLSVSYGGCLNGEAQPSRSFIQAPAIVPKSYFCVVI